MNEKSSIIQYCAPNTSNGIDVQSHFTCFELAELQEIANGYNRYIQKESVCYKNKCIVGTEINDIFIKDKKTLWNDIYERLNYLCRYEWCWLNFDFIDYIEDQEMKEKIQYFTNSSY